MESQSIVSVLLQEITNYPLRTLLGALVMAPIIYAAWYTKRKK